MVCERPTSTGSVFSSARRRPCNFSSLLLWSAFVPPPVTLLPSQQKIWISFDYCEMERDINVLRLDLEDDNLGLEPEEFCETLSLVIIGKDPNY